MKKCLQLIPIPQKSSYTDSKLYPLFHFRNHLSYSGSEGSYPTCDGAPGQIAIV